MKRTTSVLSALTLSIGLLAPASLISHADQTSDLDTLKSKYMVLMDYNSGQVLYKKNATQKMYPASTTKIWTAFCVLKKAKNLDELVEIKDIPQIEGSSMYLENGEKFTVRELLESLLIHSSNDVAYVLAKHFGGGNPQDFINYMNEEAKKFGASNTHFNNPHGLPDTDHYTTAMDMAILSRVAYGDPTISEIVKMKSVSFKASDRIKVERNLVNSNKFLTSSDTIDYKGKTIPIKYDIVDGIKTGFTDDAGNCLVSTAKKGNVRLMANVFFAPGGSLYHDSRTLIDYGLDNYKSITIYKADDIKGEKSVKFARPGKIKYKLANDYSITAMKTDSSNTKGYTYKYNFDKLEMPVKKGDIIGTMNIFKNGEMVSSIGLVAENGSQTYLQLVLSKLGINNDKKSDDKKLASKDKKASEQKDKQNDQTKKSEDKKDDAKKSENKKSKPSKDVINTIRKEGTSSVHGVLGIFSNIGDFFSDAKKSIGSLTPSSLNPENIMKSDFYKYLDKEIGNKTGPIPAPVIIFGLPILILLIILWLIISLIKDMVTGRRYKDADDQPKKKAKKKSKADEKIFEKANEQEEVQAQASSSDKADPKPEVDLESKSYIQTDTNLDSQTDIQAEVKLFSESDLKSEASLESKPDVQSQANSDIESDNRTESDLS